MISRRKIANSNERRRMQNINAGFNSLSKILPTSTDGPVKLSKATILQQSAEYVVRLAQEIEQLKDDNAHLKHLAENCPQGQSAPIKTKLKTQSLNKVSAKKVSKPIIKTSKGANASAKEVQPDVNKDKESFQSVENYELMLLKRERLEITLEIEREIRQRATVVEQINDYYQSHTEPSDVGLTVEIQTQSETEATEERPQIQLETAATQEGFYTQYNAAATERERPLESEIAANENDFYVQYETEEGEIQYAFIKRQEGSQMQYVVPSVIETGDGNHVQSEIAANQSAFYMECAPEEMCPAQFVAVVTQAQPTEEEQFQMQWAQGNYCQMPQDFAHFAGIASSQIRMNRFKLQNLFFKELSSDDEDKQLKSNKKLLEECLTTKISTVNVSTLQENSARFPIAFPVSTIKTATLSKDHSEEELERNAQNSYPVIHEDVLPLIIYFLEHKNNYGSEIEKSLYKDMGVVEFITRLFCKRAATFTGPADFYKLMSGETGYKGWELIGTNKEKPPLLLTHYLSYDEIKISALLAASSPSFFINPGGRANRGVVTAAKDVHEWGIAIGVVGCRFERHNLMEWQDMIVSMYQNIPEKGYGNSNENKRVDPAKSDLLKIWAQFYDLECFPVWQENQDFYSNENKYKPIDLGCSAFLDGEIYKKRCKMTAEVILLEANQRAKETEQNVFLHVVGLGQGVWQISSAQEKIFLDAFHEVLQQLKVPNITDIYFSWFKEDSCGGVIDGGKLGDSGITIHFGKRDPHSKLTDGDINKLLVVTYAGDGNTLPGNEFWRGLLTASGESAEACSSQIAELQNPHINPMINGNNVRVASPSLGTILFLSDFVKILLDK